MPNHDLGRYTGRLILEVLSDGRRMRVFEPFGFMDADGLHWSVPPGSIVDGASIPRALWSVIGGPFEGRYRDASVVHDYYCDVRSADWRSVHRVFYRAMLVSGVSIGLAKVMYAAVYFAGPRWSDTVTENMRLGPPAVPSRPKKADVMFRIMHDPTTLAISKMVERDGTSALEWVMSGYSPAGTSSEITLQLDKLSEMIGREDPSLRTLEAAIDEVVGFIPDFQDAPKGVSVGHFVALDRD